MEQRTWEELKALYGWCIDELSEFKGRQWKAAYYILTVYAILGLAAQHVTQGADREAYVSAAVLAAAGFIVMCCGLIVINRLEESMELRRKRMEKIRESFSQEFREARVPEDHRGKDNTGFQFMTVIVIGWVVLTAYVYRLAAMGGA